jgi:hypothetical protein
VIHRRAQLRSLEREPRVGVVWFEANDSGVFGDRRVVLLTPLGFASAAQRGGRRTAAGENGGCDHDEDPAFSAGANQ